MKRSREVEISFAVAEDTVAPDWCELPLVATVSAGQEYRLHAEYFDTPDLLLSQARIALRRRKGGKDEGWHIKQKTAAGREEFHAPYGPILPEDLHATLQDLLPELHDAPLIPIAQIDNVRTEYELRTASGEIIAEFCNDQVSTSSPVGKKLVQQWREWEVEVTPWAQDSPTVDVEEFLAAATELCQAQGADFQPDSSKLQQALYGRSSS